MNAGEISAMVIATTVLRWRRVIMGTALICGALGAATGLSKPRQFRADATLIPQGADAGAGSGLAAMAASQLGLRLPAGGGAWGVPVYLELLSSRALLDPLVNDTFVVAEERGRRVPFMELMEIDDPRPEVRAEAAVGALRHLISAREDTKIGALKITVTTRWPSVSLALAQRLISRLNEFNLETRKTQAVVERQFVEVRTAEAEATLRDAENRLQDFLQRNRAANSPELIFERDRLQREVMLRQQLYTDWSKSREEARVREVRDTPVITALEEPRLPLRPEGRGSVRRAVLGGALGAGLALLLAFIVQAVAFARREPSAEAREFFALFDQLMPRLRKKGSRSPKPPPR